jgi:hypothetical protein
MLFIHLRVTSQLTVSLASQSFDRNLHCKVRLSNDVRPAGISDRWKPLQARRETHGNKKVLKERDNDDGNEKTWRAAEFFLRNVFQVAVLQVIGRQEASGGQEEGPDPKVGEDYSSDENVQPFLGFGVVGGGAVALDHERPVEEEGLVEAKDDLKRKMELTRMSDQSDAV